MNVPYFLNAAVLSSLFIHAARSAAPKLHLLDRPGGRKTHVGAVPAVGGLGILAAFSLALSLNDNLISAYGALLATMAFLTLVGSIDDAIDLGPLKKAGFEVIAGAVLIVAGGLQIEYLGDFAPFGHIGTPAVSIVLTVVVVIGIINAVNMIDGIDGLAGGIVAAALFWLAIGAYLSGANGLATAALVLLMGVLGFLVFNFRGPWRRQAAVFLGDAGSMMLGFALVWFSLELTQGEIRQISAPGCALTLAVPALDTISLFFRRLAAGRSPFAADREHLHYLLGNAGLSTAVTAGLLISISMVLGGFGVIGSYFRIPDPCFVAVFALAAVAHSLAVKWLPHERVAPNAAPLLVESRGLR